ncbi:DUF3889 domain-containing protein [Aquibacillus albus]|uniref:Rare lipoprotein A n=1 Tax=Aquibacillus albus TaxID=1168171 RepID=A0ABS2MZD1_9BACI|nr:DUF3889 domain-containing protein [Aquibacillus albus]MBM7571237.1 rare lipoprotein A [Aquibacillus albus]
MSNYYHPYMRNHTFSQVPYYPYYQQAYQFGYPTYPQNISRQQPVKGQATWTEGGQVTQCGIPWSANQYMTAAVGGNSPYQCGQTLKIKYPTTQREVIVTVVDRVPGFPPNKINVHRRVFGALGASLDAGVINIEITPSPELEEQQWGKYLLEVTQSAYPNYNVTDYSVVEKTQLSANQTKETYDFILKSPAETINVRGTVVYNPNTNRVVSFNLKEQNS